ncbi:hypothetical protein [Aquimarina agarivorans]|uniref:hypothetical protein n=1 Tax=Aquimarina agarivorans TaxID=980584 RepID=UPI000248E78F|nr:hypothetical protein [Aquimarina agarivorans]
MENFLAKWANNELSESDKKVFEATDDNKLYQDILSGVEKLDIPAYDAEASYKKLKDKLDSKSNEVAKKQDQGKVVSMIPKWVYGVAASVILVFGLTFLFSKGHHIHQITENKLALNFLIILRLF